MSLLAATIDERISVNTGLRSLVPLLIFGMASVLYWNFTEVGHHGDLRPYVLVQFSSLAILLLLVALFRPRYTCGADLIVSLGIYALSKLLATADQPIFHLAGIVSGHNPKTHHRGNFGLLDLPHAEAPRAHRNRSLKRPYEFSRSTKFKIVKVTGSYTTV